MVVKLLKFNDWLWSLRLFNRRIGWLIITAVLTTIEIISLYAWLHFPTISVIGMLAFVIIMMMVTVQFFLILGIVAVYLMYLEDEYEFFTRALYNFNKGRVRVGLISPVELADREPSREPRATGVYKFIMDLGLCKYAQIE